MQSYVTEFSNQVHQLIISVSKRYWITNKGIVKYRHKPMEVTLANVGKSSKAYLVIYTLRDHFSGIFYSSVAPSSSLVMASDFLTEAWSKKTGHAFTGLPVHLTIPDTIESIFPGTRSFAKSKGINLPTVTSGFQGGVRDIRTIEERLKFCHDQSLEHTLQECIDISKYSEGLPSKVKGLTKAELWQQNIYSEGC